MEKVYYPKARAANGKQKDAHRLVMEMTLGRELTRNEIVHHKDENRKNFAPENLALTTHSEHGKLHPKKSAFKKGHGQIGNMGKVGENNVTSKLTEQQAIEVKAMYLAREVMVKDVARIYKISPSNVRAIGKGISWAHLP